MHLPPKNPDLQQLTGVPPAQTPRETDGFHHKSALDLAPYLVISLSTAGIILRVNAACQSLLQYRPDELRGRPILDMVTENERETTAAALFNASATERDKRFCNHCYRKDGSVIQIKWSFQRDPVGETIYCFGDDQFESFERIESMNNLEGLAALEKNILQLNIQPEVPTQEVADSLLRGIEKLYPGTACSILRLQADHTLRHYSAPSLPQQYIELVNGLAPGPAAGSCGAAVYFNRKVIVSNIDEDPLWENYRDWATPFGLKACWSVPIHHSKGTILGSFAIYHYCHKTPSASMLQTIERLGNLIGILIENSAMLEDLRLSNERYQLVAQATHDMIWDWDLQKNEIFRNEEGLRNVYGFSTNDPIRMIDDWVERIHPDDRNQVKEAIASIHQGVNKSIFETEYRFLRADGLYVYVYDRGYILRGSDGKPVRLIGAAQDMTERVKANQLIRESEERYHNLIIQEKIARQKEILNVTVAVQEKERNEIGHELHDNVNQILTSAKLYLECVGEYNEMKEEYRQMSFNLINKGIEEIRRLSKSMVPPRLNDISLIQAIEDVLSNMNAIQPLTIDFHHEHLDETRIDSGLMLAVYRIVQEQSTNILKHAEATTVLITLSQEPGLLKLVIEDNGKGFEANIQRRGIGFANILNRAEVYHGKATIESTPGNGCRLTVLFREKE
jgi:PAS domain S-box-containing protein